MAAAGGGIVMDSLAKAFGDVLKKDFEKDTVDE